MANLIKKNKILIEAFGRWLLSLNTIQSLFFSEKKWLIRILMAIIQTIALTITFRYIAEHL